MKQGIFLEESGFAEERKVLWDEIKVVRSLPFTLDPTDLVADVTIPKGTPIYLDYTTNIAYVVQTTETLAALFDAGATPTLYEANALLADERINKGSVAVSGIIAGLEIVEENLPYPIDAANKASLAQDKYFFFHTF